MILDIVPVQSEKRVQTRDELLVRFLLFDGDDKLPSGDLGPLRVLVFEPIEQWKGYGWAQPIASGLYEVAFPAPRQGDYYLFFAFPSSGIGYAQLPHLILQTSEEGTTVVNRAPETTPADRIC